MPKDSRPGLSLVEHQRRIVSFYRFEKITDETVEPSAKGHLGLLTEVPIAKTAQDKQDTSFNDAYYDELRAFVGPDNAAVADALYSLSLEPIVGITHLQFEDASGTTYRCPKEVGNLAVYELDGRFYVHASTAAFLLSKQSQGLEAEEGLYTNENASGRLSAEIDKTKVNSEELLRYDNWYTLLTLYQLELPFPVDIVGQAHRIFEVTKEGKLREVFEYEFSEVAGLKGTTLLQHQRETALFAIQKLKDAGPEVQENAAAEVKAALKALGIDASDAKTVKDFEELFERARPKTSIIESCSTRQWMNLYVMMLNHALHHYERWIVSKSKIGTNGYLGIGIVNRHTIDGIRKARKFLNQCIQSYFGPATEPRLNAPQAKLTLLRDMIREKMKGAEAKGLLRQKPHHSYANYVEHLLKALVGLPFDKDARDEFVRQCKGLPKKAPAAGVVIQRATA